MIGMTLIADGFGFHIERGYIYAAMFFSSLVETLERARAAQREAIALTPVLARSCSPLSISPPSRRPGPGIAALVARVLGHGLAASAPFIAGYVVGDMIWLILRGNGPERARQRVRRRCSPRSNIAGAAYLLYVAWKMATAPAAIGGRRRRGLARMARLFRLAVADPRQSQGDDLLSVDHAARRRRQDADAGSLIAELAAVLGAVISCDARRLRPRRQPGARAFCARRARCASPIAPPAASWRASRSRSRRGEAMSDLLAIGEALVELNQPSDGAPFVQGFGGDTSNAMIAAARLGRRRRLFHRGRRRPFRPGADRALDARGGRREPRSSSTAARIPGSISSPTGRTATSSPTCAPAPRRAGSARPTCRSTASARRRSSMSPASARRSRPPPPTPSSPPSTSRATAGRLVSYDPNLRLKLWPLRRARAIIHEAMRALRHRAAGTRRRRGADRALAIPTRSSISICGLGARVVGAEAGQGGRARRDGERAGAHLPRKVAAVDATGAGDCFDGAFLAEFARAGDPFAAARFANVAAALSTLGYGAVAPLPRRAEVEAAMKRADEARIVTPFFPSVSLAIGYVVACLLLAATPGRGHGALSVAHPARRARAGLRRPGGRERGPCRPYDRRRARPLRAAGGLAPRPIRSSRSPARSISSGSPGARSGTGRR